jgi:putative hydrolase of the HAD superfamily
MQARIGIQIDYLINQGLLNEDILQAALKIFSEGEVPIIDNMHDLAQHFVDIIAGYCYDYARRCTLDNIPLLEKLSDCYEIALVSNFYGNLASVIQDFGLSRCFRVVIDSAVVGVRKPDPEIFQLAIDKLHLEPKDITVIGDSYKKDIEPARELGCNAIWLRGSSWDNSDSAIEYEPTVTSLLQLFDMLQKNA